MKKSILTILASMMMLFVILGFNGLSAKDKSDLVVASYSKEGGNGWIIGNLLAETITDTNSYNVEMLNAGSCLNLAKHIKESKDNTPTIFLQSPRSAGLKLEKGCDLTPKAENFVVIAYKRVNAICSVAERNFNDIMKQDEITIAHSNTFPARIFTELAKVTGKKIKSVPYRSSGSAFKGIIAGDTDLLYTGLTKREAGSAKVKCWTTTNPEKIGDMEPMGKVFPGYSMATVSEYYYVQGRNMNAKQTAKVRKVILEALKGDKWKAYIIPSKMIPGYELEWVTYDDLLQSVVQWGFDPWNGWVVKGSN